MTFMLYLIFLLPLLSYKENYLINKYMWVPPTQTHPPKSLIPKGRRGEVLSSSSSTSPPTRKKGRKKGGKKRKTKFVIVELP